MKRNRLYLLFILTSFIFSCENYLDTYPGNKYDDATIWKNTDLIESYVFGIYEGIPYPHTWLTNASLVDESVPIQNSGVTDRILQSTLTPEEPGAFVPNWAACMDGWWWDYVYSDIRACNLFFDKIKIADNTPEIYKEQLQGEVHFLRGYMYFLLLEQYGGVPLLEGVYNIGDDVNIPRNTFEETVNFIIADLDAALENDRLKKQTDKTRATEGSVLALKTRVLLYAASDLYHRTSEWAPGYAHPELIGYMGGNRNELYSRAKEAAGAVMQLGYTLYNNNPDPELNFQELFLEMSSSEQILITSLDRVNNYWAQNWIAWISGAPTYGGSALNQITGNLANSFENRDGSKFNFAAQVADPYANRDPRFNATILHHGSPWFSNINSVLKADTIDITTGTGVDYNKGTTTGYYIKKFISPTENDYYQGTPQPQPYIHLRYAEVLLNYAEACLGLNEEANAKQALNQIRHRAGMPDIPAGESGQELVDHYRNERMVELALEAHRFFDVRRWMIAPDSYKEAWGVEFDGLIYKEAVFENRNWDNRNYMAPIQYDEIQKNLALIQNPGY